MLYNLYNRTILFWVHPHMKTIQRLVRLGCMSLHVTPRLGVHLTTHHSRWGWTMVCSKIGSILQTYTSARTTISNLEYCHNLCQQVFLFLCPRPLYSPFSINTIASVTINFCTHYLSSSILLSPKHKDPNCPRVTLGT